MRLTLRTLIAWLDDTLTPSEVKAIGHQVSESPFAKELIERIHRVTRQRRLTVPADSGADSLDPNIVASYLDNQLKDEGVNDFEKKCLTSDVHLAEVASVHQILSMIGHKAKVPADARGRMYRLVRGREAAPRPKSRAPRAAERAPAEAASRPQIRWSTPARTTPKVLERFGPLAGVLALIGLLVFVAWSSLQPAATRTASPDPARAADRVVQQPEPAPAAPIAAPAPIEPAKAEAEAARADLAKAEAAKKADATRPEANSRDEVGSVDAINGVVLRSPVDAATWEPVEAKAPLKPQTRLLNFTPFRNLVRTGAGEVTLVDSAEVVFDHPEREEASRFELRRGKALVQGLASPPLPYNVRFEGHVLAIVPAPGRVVGVERVDAFTPGTAEPAATRLRVSVPDGKATLKVGEVEESLDGPGEILLQVSGQFAEKREAPAPAWVTQAAPSAFDKEVATQFAGYFRPGRPILANLVEAMDDNTQAKVKEFAVDGLGTLGDMESVVIGLDRRDDLAFHRAVVDVLRAGLTRGGDSAKAVREALARQYEAPWPQAAEALIVGLPADAARDEAALGRLVEHLANAPSRGIRALALDNLRALTGRDSLEYDVDNPEGKGLRAWQDLARKRELSKGAAAAGAPPAR